MIDLDHVDATFKMFDPDHVLERIKPKPMPPRAHGFKEQVSRGILNTLRTEGTMDGRALTIRLMAERDLNPNDKALAKAMQKRIGAALYAVGLWCQKRPKVTLRAHCAGL